MNREIKFRAWDKIDKEMFRVIMLTAPQGKDYLIVSGRGGSTTTDKGNCILMQYTGLKDKNGKEIYEGDVALCENENRIVEWANSGWHYSGRAFHLGCYPDAEIIGNIHQNPELLK